MRIGFLKTSFVLLFTTMLFMIMPAIAQDNIISSVTISKAKNKVNFYELSIDSTDVSNYKVNIENNDNIYFDLKNSALATDASTYYEDVSSIDSVIVKQVSKNKVRIYVQGKNARNTELIFSNSVLDDTAAPNKKITINRPMIEYSSIKSEDLEDMDNIQEWDDNSFNLGQLLSYLRESYLGIILVFLMIFGIIAGAIKALSSKISQEKVDLIGINPKKDARETAFETIYPNRNTGTDNLQSISRRSQALQNAQNELAKAHQKYQEYLTEKYGNNPPKKQIPADAILKGIALNQYSKSTQNPYKNQPVIKMNEINEKRLNSKGGFQIPPRTTVQGNMTVQRNTSPYIQRPQRNLEINQPKKTTTNMKFLESVTKIYEQTGRADLANDLKNTISKAKQSV